MADISPASTRLKALLHTIRDGLHRSLDTLRQDAAGNKLPDVLVNDGDVKAAALYLRDVGLKYDGLRLDAEFARLCNRCMDEWFASMADGESQEYRDKLTELFGPFPSQENSDDSVVADRRVAIVGWVVQLSEFVDELIRSVTALAGTQPDATDANGQPPVNRDKQPEELTGEAKALALLVQHPEWTDTAIAEAVPCSRTTLYDWPNFRAAREALRQGRGQTPRGTKDDAGNLEAWR